MANPPEFEQVLEWPNLLAAFERVRANEGGPGVDGVTLARFERNLDAQLRKLQRELSEEIYAPLPLLKILVEKKNGEPRGLSIPTVYDRVAQSAVLRVIEPVLEAQFEDCSFAYRKGRSVRQAVDRVQQLYEEGYRWAVRADIDAFFDNVSHGDLLRKVKRSIKDARIVRLIRLWVAAEVWDGKQVAPLPQGIPQGSVVSPILSNLFLDELDEKLEADGYRLVRFSDDFLILCKTPEQAHEALELTGDILKAMSLALNEAEVINFDQGFMFLGVLFVRSLAMMPLHRLHKERKVLYVPPPLDLAVYRLKKAKGW